MGIYKTSSIGVRRKSVGEITYKSVRGRVIASAKITENASKTSAQTEQRSAFGIMGQSAKVMASWIDLAFSKTKYGSQRNQFVKQNSLVMSWLKENKRTLKGNSLEKFSMAVASGISVLSGYGPNFAEPTFTQAGSGLTVSIVFSKDFIVGDIVKIGVMQTYSKPGANGNGLVLISHFSSVKIYEYVITDDDLGNNIISIGVDKIAGLGTAVQAPAGFTQESIIAAVSVLSNKETCQSYFSSLNVYNSGGDDRPEIE
ncbi:hypothetical protein NXY11_07400 [Parabacteroides faecis]|uniref:hypothetical protein n=1 Tax=Parabacteroides faecis TaxID=1217282 RepID=UPI002164EC6D|nr:hypothetical protein [Parabacteroides faecis]MCS2893354.1 hypothetical protein [Parabacteroides faecis]UVQ48040.1 hypothetical protein NXY11_07400 [Parabacteroides faecis]